MGKIFYSILVGCLMLSFNPILAQNPKALIRGFIHDKSSSTPIAQVEVILPHLKMMTVTNQLGYFELYEVPSGTHEIRIRNGFDVEESFKIWVSVPESDLGILFIEPAIHSNMDNSTEISVETISATEHSLLSDEEGGSNGGVSGILSASRDPFMATVAFTFGSMRYRLRGYAREKQEVYINGMYMNDIKSGVAFWSQWGGLNDMFRNQSSTLGLNNIEQGFGGLAGTTSIEASAKIQLAQTRITYSNSNRSYRHRTMITHNTGMTNKGWALAISASKRWAKEGYIPGTFYDANAFFAAITKRISSRSFLHITTLGVEQARGKLMPATQETLDLAGSNFYNPNWGYINGEKRNSRTFNAFQPIVMLNYEYRPRQDVYWNIAAKWQGGYSGNTALDWYNAMDPRPDYYRNLPSFYLYDPKGEQIEMAVAKRSFYEQNPEKLQIDWERIYEANRMNIETFNGVNGRRSVYIIGQDREDIENWSLSTNFYKSIHPKLKLFAGAYGAFQSQESYKKLLDLLGGDYYVNLNQFAERSYLGNNDLIQNDKNQPNRIVREGGKYAYHYKSYYTKANIWTQLLFQFRKWELFAAWRGVYDRYQREGLYLNGIFPQDSYGKSHTHIFWTQQTKAGITYKIDGRNYLFLNAAYFLQAPLFDNTFFSPRTRNSSVESPQLETTSAIEGGYLLRSPYLSGRLQAFASQHNHAVQIKRFYHEDFRTFVNYVMQGVDTRHLGAEVAMQAALHSSLSVTAVATWMQVFYTSRPQVSIYRDNDTTGKVESSIAYINNYYVAVGPQSAYNVGLNYRSPKYWYASLNFTYLDRNYMDINPARRTDEAIDMISPHTDDWEAILGQKRLPLTFTIDFFGGKSWMLSRLYRKIPYGVMLYLNIGVNNILNDRDMITGAFEQLRFDYTGRQPERFPEKYFYALGRNYFLNISLKF